MLQISSKSAKRAILVVFSKINLNALPFFDLEEKKVIQSKLDGGLKVIPFTKQYKTYILFAMEISEDKDLLQ